MTIPSETKVFLSIGAATIGLIIVVAIFFSRPAGPVTNNRLLPPGAHTRGNATAAATLVEFSDFQCPACKAYQPVVDELLQKYKENIYFSYRHFPLPQHTFGQSAARAAEAAGKQGKFWDMYALLFAKQEDFSDTLWLQLAKELNLNEEQFQKDYASQAVVDKVNLDKADGLSLGVNSTPTFFLNGVKLPPMNFDEFKQKVETQLRSGL